MQYEIKNAFALPNISDQNQIRTVVERTFWPLPDMALFQSRPLQRRFETPPGTRSWRFAIAYVVKCLSPQSRLHETELTSRPEVRLDLR